LLIDLATFRSFYDVLNCILHEEFRDVYLHLPRPDKVPPEIKNFPNYSRFGDCLAAIDGTHVPFYPATKDAAPYRNKSGRLSMNVLAACTFDLRFCYVLVGWEGSACDSHIFYAARQADLSIPPGKYYLGDAGFPSCDVLLVPYRNVRYHLKEWDRGNNRFVECLPNKYGFC
jgi:hypothetical protein